MLNYTEEELKLREKCLHPEEVFEFVDNKKSENEEDSIDENENEDENEDEKKQENKGCLDYTQNYPPPEIYEQVINSSRLFTLDKDKETSDYEKEKYEMFTLLYYYACSQNPIKKGTKIEDTAANYSLEICELSLALIKSYDIALGPFSHYFNKAWKNAREKAKAKEYYNNKPLKYSQDAKLVCSKHKKLLNNTELEYKTFSTKQQAEFLSENFGWGEDYVYGVLCSYIQETNTVSINDSYIDEDGESCELEGRLSAPSAIGICDAVEKSEQDAILEKYFSEFDKIYCSQQERTKPIISDILTARIVGDYDLMCKAIKHEFVSKEVMEYYAENRKAPSQRQIAEKHGKKEESISRICKTFLDKFKNS